MVSSSHHLPVTRLIFKNLPKYLTQARLLSHLLKSLPSAPTDCRLFFTPNKQKLSRRFAFVGFATSKEAAYAKEFFNGTFLDTCKIIVEEASNRHIPWSKHTRSNISRNSSKEHGFNDGRAGNSKVLPTSNGLKPDNRQKVSIENVRQEQCGDTNMKKNYVDFKKAGTSVIRTHLLFDEDVNVDVQDNFLPTEGNSWHEEDFEWLKRKGLSSNELTGGMIAASGNDVSFLPDKMSISPGNSESINRKNDSAAGEATLPNLKVTIGGALQVPSNLEREIISVENTLENSNSDLQTRLITEEGRIMLLNIPYMVSDADILKLCKPFGEVSEVILPLDEDSGKSRGFAFVSYMFPDHALQAYYTLNDSTFMGRRLFVCAATPKPSSVALNPTLENRKPLTYKAKKEKLMRENAEDLKHTWNLLYTSGNSAADTVASQLGLDKSDIVDLEATDSLAVRVAHAETHLIYRTKLWLKQEGIKVNAFERVGSSLLTAKPLATSHSNGATDAEIINNKKSGVNNSITPAFSRVTVNSEDTIIVKHLPSLPNISTSELITELRGLFESVGSLLRFCLAPSRLVAVVRYFEKKSAKLAFKKFALRPFRDTPLYLEWAPIDIFDETGGADVPGEIAGDTVSYDKTDVNVFSRVLSGSGSANATNSVGNISIVKSKRSMKNVEKNHRPPESIESTLLSENARKFNAKLAIPEENFDQHEMSSTIISDKDDMHFGEDGNDTERSCSIFVKNLSFSTTLEALKRAFSDCIGFRSATIKTKKKAVKNDLPLGVNNGSNEETNTVEAGSSLGKNNTQLLSMGYGFVEFSDFNTAYEAIKKNQGKMLDNHSLVLSISKSRQEGRKTKECLQKIISASEHENIGNYEFKKSKKLIVKNLPFQATKQEIQQLFSSYANVAAVRIPRKVDGSLNRGYAFVEFLTHTDLETARESLQHTHLYGRHLVIQEAFDDEEGGIRSVVTAMQKAKRERMLSLVRSETDSKKKRKIDDLNTNIEA